MSHFYHMPFQPELHSTNSSESSFQSNGNIASSANALQSSGVREWIHGPSGRALRFAESSGTDYYIELGSSTVTAASSKSMLMLGGTVEIVRVQPNQTYVAIQSASTTVAAAVTVTLGRGQ